uniref:Putative dopamine n-acetyltransferase-like protein n=1 Tax=Nyssomyia neivai TaxID=330878 RepID=A0A1L8DCH3_9DIPT
MGHTIVERLILKNRQIIVRLSEKSDYDRVLEFLRLHFYPFDKSSHGRISGRQSKEDEFNEMKTINSGATVLAFTDDAQEELIGISLAIGHNEEESHKNLATYKKLSKIRGYPNNLEGLIFVEEMKIRSQLYRRLGINRAMYLSIAAVREDFQRLSLGKRLMQKNLDYARKLGYSVAFGVTVTTKGIRINDSLGFKSLYSINFVDYKDYRGLAIYNSFPPHHQAIIHVKYLM